MTVWAAPYTLRPRSTLSARANPAQERLGALIKVETPEGVGYADVHPWVELGDEPLSLQLKYLAEGRPSRLGQRSLDLAALDRRARAQRVSIFTNLSIPASHFLINDLLSESRRITTQTFSQVRELGCRTLKVKVGRDLRSEAKGLTLLQDELKEFRLRLDVNGLATFDQLSSFTTALPEPIRASIEFIEDPMVMHPESWCRLHQETGLDLALDSALNRRPDLDIQTLQACWQVVVYKPAAQTRADIKGNTDLVVTSYLDHPVGQLGAALEAALIARDRKSDGLAPLRACGLISHFSYEPNPFSEQITVRPNADGAVLIPPSGTGIGFDDLLDQQTWQRLG